LSNVSGVCCETSLVANISLVNAGFDYHFIPSNENIPVYASLTTSETLALTNLATPADLTMFLSVFSHNLLTNEMFARSFQMQGCEDSCLTFLLPGSITVAPSTRSFISDWYSSTYNITLVHCDNCTGFAVRYDAVPPEGIRFNITADCTYTGAVLDNGLQICFLEDDGSLLVGWSACPSEIMSAACVTRARRPPGESRRWLRQHGCRFIGR